jgi:hypothetical protein
MSQSASGETAKKQTPSFVTFANGFQHRDDRGIPDSPSPSDSSLILVLSVFAPLLSHPSLHLQLARGNAAAQRFESIAQMG